jgi:hypothetical protein
MSGPLEPDARKQSGPAEGGDKRTQGRSGMDRTIVALVIALLTWSPLDAQTPQQHLEEARKLLRDVPVRADDDLAARISTLQQDFNNFASEYLLQDSPGTVAATAEAGAATDQSDWRSRYLLVEAGLTALIGPPDASATNRNPALDPQLRERLQQVRTHLQTFYAATIQAREGNPVAHTGSAPSSQTPVAPTAAAPQTRPSGRPKPETRPAQVPATPDTATEGKPAVGIDPSTALFLLERIQSILDQAVKEESSTEVTPVGTSGAASGKVTIERALFDEVRAELNQIKALLKK